ncbi:MAG: biotin--[acetyl-CoA-carboxylase] ligase [Bacteroidota bacterium]|nr:biotin--[acetyl-CoA-carboxylase] ligase [Bacteroidota bacterium]MDP4215076.1 biotin--[acetyl-CoA-carboxylase] ligase [Bacteroidota bacterium]MDP4244596.1 biotin--[acetyl-CoA-carboxylase] ligase [Bacteroidota bacterium]MDP4255579.1 biotin--[acetyl-CoA-carboxylase] ligase [Bacteroidota bacterium]MDP4258009.1 biotin--[acetyl-CoA-carboxylase] ligase [Bacteroidota bacterium]
MPIGHAFIELGSVDSTNNYAMARVHAGSASHGTIFFAHEQWAGKGQRGKTWASRPGENIVMSVVLEPAFLPVARQFELSAAIGLACHDLLSRLVPGNELAIKWPNDLYWRDRKAGGILIENVFRGDHWLFAIAGIGINVNQTLFPETLRNPVSLKQITGRTFDVVKIAGELGGDLERRYEQLRASIQGEGSDGGVGGDGGPTIMEDYNSRLYKRGRTVTLKQADRLFETTIGHVTEKGELVTQDRLPQDSPDRIFRFGEVEWFTDGSPSMP